MSALPMSQPKTVDDLLALEAATGKRFEIVNDEFVEMAVSDRSSETNAAFSYYLFGYVNESKFGRVYDSEMMYALPKSSRKADVSVIRKDRLPTSEITRFDGAGRGRRSRITIGRME